MSYPLVIRLMLAMSLMPDASYGEALARVAGLLADVPFTLEWHVPTSKVVTGWRLLIPADVMEDLFWHAAGPLIADDEPSAVTLAGMTVLAADGMLVSLADTPANRAMFGSTGTADDSAPFPQLRVVALTARAGRALLGAVLGSVPGRGADPAEAARPAPPGAVRRPRDLLRPELSCATRRTAVSPAQRVQTGGGVCGPDGLPGSVRLPRDKSMPGNRRSLPRRTGRRAGRPAR